MILNEVLQRGRQHQAVHLHLELLLVPPELVPDDGPGHVLEGDAGEATQVPQLDLALAPDGADHGEERTVRLETVVSPTQELVTNSEAQRATVHVEDHGEDIRDSPLQYTGETRETREISAVDVTCCWWVRELG